MPFIDSHIQHINNCRPKSVHGIGSYTHFSSNLICRSKTNSGYILRYFIWITFENLVYTISIFFIHLKRHIYRNSVFTKKYYYFLKFPFFGIRSSNTSSFTLRNTTYFSQTFWLLFNYSKGIRFEFFDNFLGKNLTNSFDNARCKISFYTHSILWHFDFT